MNTKWWGCLPVGITNEPQQMRRVAQDPILNNQGIVGFNSITTGLYSGPHK
jgi:hypothetical protein